MSDTIKAALEKRHEPETAGEKANIARMAEACRNQIFPECRDCRKFAASCGLLDIMFDEDKSA